MTSVASSMTVAERLMRRTPHRQSLVLVAAAFALLAPMTARAAEPSPAESLFREGRALLDAKRYDEACPKLAESQRLEPGAGTLLALAMCHEAQGKPATAAAELKRASELGRRVGRQDLASAAARRAQALESSVPHLVVRLPEKEGSAYRVRCDGEPIGQAELGAPLPLDPGEHRVDVAADGTMSRSYVVRLTGAGTVEILVERLDDMAASPRGGVLVTPPKPAPDPRPVTAAPDSAIAEAPPSRGAAQRTTGLVLVGAGVLGLGAGAYFGGQALSESSQPKRLCPDASCPDAEAVGLNDSAKDSFKLSVLSLAAGTSAITVGAIVYFLAPHGPASRGDAKAPRGTARVIPAAGPSGVSLGVVGTF